MSVLHNRPLISDADRQAVSAVLASGWIAEGPVVTALEKAFAAMNGGGASCAVSSGTAALFLALRGLGVADGDVVAVPSYSCSALLNAVNMLSARPMPVDVRADDFTIDPASVARLAPNAKTVVAVHTFGASAPVSALKAAGKLVVEDCCQSLGGPQGREGDAAVYSFYATKIITGGQGGLVWDSSGKISEATRDYREFDCRETYEPRFNFQMTDIQAAMILSQFERLADIRARRCNIREKYLASAKPLLTGGWKTQTGLDAAAHLPYRFVLLAPNGQVRDGLQAKLKSAGVSSIAPVEPYELLHRYMKLNAKDYPASEMLAAQALSIPLHPSLSDADVETVCNVLKQVA